MTVEICNATMALEIDEAKREMRGYVTCATCGLQRAEVKVTVGELQPGPGAYDLLRQRAQQLCKKSLSW